MYITVVLLSRVQCLFTYYTAIDQQATRVFIELYFRFMEEILVRQVGYNLHASFLCSFVIYLHRIMKAFHTVSVMRRVGHYYRLKIFTMYIMNVHFLNNGEIFLK